MIEGEPYGPQCGEQIAMRQAPPATTPDLLGTPRRGMTMNMNKGILRWVHLIVAFWACGPIAAWLTLGLRAPDGGSDFTLILSDSPVSAFLRVGTAILLAALVGMVGSALFGARTGLFSAGLVIVWPAWMMGSIEGIVRRTHSSSAFITLAIEGLILAVVLIAGAWLIARAQRTSPPAPRSKFTSNSIVPMAAGALGACAAIGAVAAWGFARSELPGQAIAAAIVAGIFGTLVGTVIDPRPGMLRFVAALSLLAIAGPASAAILQGGEVVRAMYAGELVPLARLLPLHWVAGLLLGVPIGASWAESFIKREA